MSSKWHVASGSAAGVLSGIIDVPETTTLKICVGKGSSYGHSRGGDQEKAINNSISLAGGKSYILSGQSYIAVSNGGYSHYATGVGTGGTSTVNSSCVLSSYTKTGGTGTHLTGDGHGAQSVTAAAGKTGFKNIPTLSSYGCGGGGVFSKTSYSTGFNGYNGKNGYILIETIE